MSFPNLDPGNDRAHLATALDMIRAAAPATAAYAVLATSDDPGTTYGFRLVDVLNAEHRTVTAERVFDLWPLGDEVDEHLSDLDWDGVVGEDESGHAVLALPAATARGVRCDRCGDESNSAPDLLCGRVDDDGDLPCAGTYRTTEV